MKDFCCRTVQEGKGCFVPFQYRKNVQTLTYKVGIPTLKKRLLKHTHNTIRPILTDKNKADRVAWCCSFVCGMVSLLTYWRGWISTRSGLLNRSCKKLHLYPWGDPKSPNMQTQETHQKEDCLTAIAQPWQNPQMGEWWGGNIGTCIFTKQVHVQRNYENWPSGMLETKSITIDKKELVDMSIDNLNLWRRRATEAI